MSAERQQRRVLDLPRIWRRPDVLISSILINLLALAMPFVILQVYDRVLPNHATETFTLLLAGLVMVAIFDAVLRIARSTALAWCGAQYEHLQSMRVLHQMMRSDLLKFESRPAGYYLDRLQSLEKVRSHYTGQSILLIVDLPFVVLFLGLISAFAGSLVIVPVLFIAAFLWLSIRMGGKLRRAIEQHSDMDQRRQNFLIEVLSGIHTVKSMAMEAAMSRRYERLQMQSAQSIFELGRVNSVVQGLGANFSQVMMVVFVSIGSLAVVADNLTIGALAAGTMLCGRVLQPAMKGMLLWTQLQGVRYARDKTEQLLNLEHEAVDEGEAEVNLKGGVELRNIHFSHEGGEQELLKGIDLSIRPGEWIGITGANGSGKSTLLNLIIGFITPTEGEVLLDGQDISRMDRASVRSQIGLMPQDGVLFNGTILENITMFRDGRYVDEAIELTRKIGLDRAVRTMPEGLDTRIGGAVADTVSGGMRNRIIIVRGLVGQPPILLFDDANASFDMRNDSALVDFLRTYRGIRTMVMVSHRPSMLRLCDRTFELDNGHLIKRDYTPPVSTPKPGQVLTGMASA